MHLFSLSLMLFDVSSDPIVSILAAAAAADGRRVLGAGELLALSPASN